MGSVALILRVMPESPEVDLNVLTEQIRKKVPGLIDRPMAASAVDRPTTSISLVAFPLPGLL